MNVTSDLDWSTSTIKEVFRLSSYEARLYMAGLTYREATLSDLAKRADIPRTATYPPLQSLLKRGFFSKIKIRKRTYYQAINPHDLKLIYDRNRSLLEEVVQGFTQTIIAPHANLSARYFTGKDGLLTASELFLKESSGKTWKSFEHPAHTAIQLGTKRIDDYVKRRVKRKIVIRSIIPADSVSPWLKERISKNKEELRESVIVSPDFYPIEALIVISNNMIQFASVKNDVFSVLLENEALAKTLGSIHDMVWDRYKN